VYTKQFEIRWSDVDANLHLRNSAYIDYMSHTRMSYFQEKGFNQNRLHELQLGPVALYEHMFYFQEVFPGKPISVSLQLKGVSEDGSFFSFVHNFYDAKGKNLARCEMLGAWINLNTRKLTHPPQELWDFLDEMDKTEDYKTITKEDTRKFGQVPKDLSL
tara:strand:+ start:18703 stop:19182 length:480 start_codon:yes stop_codon:yes gene_type:complete